MTFLGGSGWRFLWIFLGVTSNLTIFMGYFFFKSTTVTCVL